MDIDGGPIFNRRTDLGFNLVNKTEKKFTLFIVFWVNEMHSGEAINHRIILN